jgi:hypothetical protein
LWPSVVDIKSPGTAPLTLTTQQKIYRPTKKAEEDF